MNNNELENQEAKDEKELDCIFSNVTDTKLKKAIRKAKRHSLLRNALISFVVLGVVAIGGSIANRELVYNMERQVQIAEDNFNKISAPNKYIGKVSRYHEILGGRNEYTTYKIIESKVVFTGEGGYNYGLLRNEWGNMIGTESPSILGISYDTEQIRTQKYNELGQREMVFFYPFISYAEYKNDLQLLDAIGSNKIMEMALSFDQAYPMVEVKNMLPDNVTLSWYWLDDLSEQEQEASKSHKTTHQNSNGETIEVESSDRIRSERTVYGIKAYDNNGEILEDPVQLFTQALQNGMERDTRLKGEFERVYLNVAGQDGQLTKDDIKVWGVVVTGEGKELKSLTGLPFIKASSVGVITEKY